MTGSDQHPIIDPEFAAVLRPLDSDEFAALEASIVAEGCRDPLVVWAGRGVLLDGHHRLAICERHGLPYETREIDLPDRDAAICWIILNQEGRRNEKPFEKAERAMVLEAHLPGKQGARTDLTSVPYGTEVTDPPSVAAPKALGISRRTYERAKVVATHADEETKAKLKAGETTVNAEYRRIKQQQGKEERERLLAEQLDQTALTPTIALASYEDWLPQQPLCDLLLTDPPYSTDLGDVRSFAEFWLPLALSRVKPSGRAYVFVGAYPDELHAYLDVASELEPIWLAQVLVWTYRNTLGPTPARVYKQNWQAVLYFIGPDCPPLDCPKMVEQFSVQDVNAPDGRQGDRYHAWQKPDELAERFIRHATAPGDVVYDCFAGTGTHLLAAARLGRVGFGCDNDPEMLAIAQSRGCHRAG